jgi:hypothetical protein
LRLRLPSRGVAANQLHPGYLLSRSYLLSSPISWLVLVAAVSRKPRAME